VVVALVVVVVALGLVVVVALGLVVVVALGLVVVVGRTVVAGAVVAGAVLAVLVDWPDVPLDPVVAPSPLVEVPLEVDEVDDDGPEPSPTVVPVGGPVVVVDVLTAEDGCDRVVVVRLAVLVVWRSVVVGCEAVVTGSRRKRVLGPVVLVLVPFDDRRALVSGAGERLVRRLRPRPVVREWLRPVVRAWLVLRRSEGRVCRLAVVAGLRTFERPPPDDFVDGRR
jgi:hypothetical protein